MPARNLVLLAAGQARAGKAEQSAQTIQIAAQRGWREPLAQEAMLRLALAAGDKPEAARRYIALFLRSKTPNSLLIDLGPAVLGEGSSEGRAAMAAILAGAERWRSTFLQRGAQVIPPSAFSAIMVDSLERGVTFDCAMLGRSIKQVSQRDAAAATPIAAAAARQCPEPATTAAARLKRSDNP
jgi:hypothetical protein